MTNPYEQAARIRKVAALVAALRSHGITADQMAGASEAEWAMAAEGAGVRAAKSPATRAAVVDQMRWAERPTRIADVGALYNAWLAENRASRARTGAKTRLAMAIAMEEL